MRRIVLLVLGSLALGGCMPPPNMQGEIAATSKSIKSLSAMSEKALLAGRMQYVQKHPGDPYDKAIEAGAVVVGMTREDVEAAGYSCVMKEASVDGTVEACTDEMMAAKDADAWADIPGGDPNPPGPHYVGFGRDGTVLSVSY